MTDGKLTAGEVEIELAGETRVLKPTIKACLDLSRKWKGFAHIERALLTRDFDAFVDVAMAGLDERDRGKIEQAVYETGVIGGSVASAEGDKDLLNRLVEFVLILQRGGRSLDKEEPASGEASGG